MPYFPWTARRNYDPLCPVLTVAVSALRADFEPQAQRYSKWSRTLSLGFLLPGGQDFARRRVMGDEVAVKFRKGAGGQMRPGVGHQF